MKEGFRQSMAWLHTWSGLLVGWLLFLVFSAGTAAYFRDEITLWMKPELHAAAHPPVPQTVALGHAQTLLEGRAANASRWFITMPSEREPAVRASWLPAKKKEATEVKPRGARSRHGSGTERATRHPRRRLFLSPALRPPLHVAALGALDGGCRRHVHAGGDPVGHRHA